jgi:hypothetical protein
MLGVSRPVTEEARMERKAYVRQHQLRLKTSARCIMQVA